MLPVFARKPFGTHTQPNLVEIALDLTADAIILYQRASHGHWKKFATAQLDDPEFPIVIGLLRTEIESHSGGNQPARLWLPGDQVLVLRTRIGGGSHSERLQAAFDHLDRETVYRSNDVAIALSPANADGETTLLITFAETWHEARSYALRWGFTLGEVSTRHNAGDFEPDGPVFHLKSPPPNPVTQVKPKRFRIAALALIALAAVSSVLALRPWAPHLDEIEVFPEPVIPTFAQAMSPILSPRGFEQSTNVDTEHVPAAGRSLARFEPPALPSTPSVLLTADVAPTAPPYPEPSGREHEIAAPRVDPESVTPPKDRSLSPVTMETSKLADPPVRIDEVKLLVNGKRPPVKVPAIIPVESPPNPEIPATRDSVEQSQESQSPLPVPIPVPRPARLNPEEHEVVDLGRNTLSITLPPIRPTELQKSVIQTPRPTTAEIPNDVASIAPAEGHTSNAPTKFANLTSPLPRKRPAMFRNLPSNSTLPAVTGLTKRSIRAAATEQGLPLDQTTLIGIFNIVSGRKALLRLPNGRYRSVIVGDELEGWRVNAIGTDTMRVTRAGEDRTLQLVNR